MKITFEFDVNIEDINILIEDVKRWCKESCGEEPDISPETIQEYFADRDDIMRPAKSLRERAFTVEGGNDWAWGYFARLDLREAEKIVEAYENNN